MLLRDLWGVRSFYPSFKWWAGYFGMIDLVERNDQCENPKSWNIVSKEMSCTMWARGGRRDMTRGVPWSLPLVSTTSAIRSWTQKCFFSFILSFSSSLEERVCSGKNVVRKQKELAKINKHGMSYWDWVLQDENVLGWVGGTVHCTPPVGQLYAIWAQKWVRRHHWTAYFKKAKVWLVEVKGKTQLGLEETMLVFDCLQWEDFLCLGVLP